jgi:hypothetical protein
MARKGQFSLPPAIFPSDCLLYFFLSFFRVTEVPSQGLGCLLGRCFTTWALPPVIFCFIFQVGSPASDHDPLTYGLTHSWDHRWTPPCPAYRLRWGSLTFCPECPPKQILLIPAFWVAWDYRCEPSYPVWFFLNWYIIIDYIYGIQCNIPTHDDQVMLISISVTSNIYHFLVLGTFKPYSSYVEICNKSVLIKSPYCALENQDSFLPPEPFPTPSPAIFLHIIHARKVSPVLSVHAVRLGSIRSARCIQSSIVYHFCSAFDHLMIKMVPL